MCTLALVDVAYIFSFCLWESSSLVSARARVATLLDSEIYSKD